MLGARDLAEQRASISSTKMEEGAWWRAMSKRSRTSFSDSPRYFDASVEVDTLKKVVSHSAVGRGFKDQKLEEVQVGDYSSIYNLRYTPK